MQQVPAGVASPQRQTDNGSKRLYFSAEKPYNHLAFQKCASVFIPSITNIVNLFQFWYFPSYS